MRTFSDISSEHLLIALVKKLRSNDGQTAHPGTHFDSLLATVVGTSLFKQEEFDELLRTFVADGTLALLGRLSFHDGSDRKIKNSEHGRITSLHAEAAVVEHQFFTENWTPIVARRSGDTGRRLYPTDDMSYHRLKITMVYIVEDGLLDSFEAEPVIYPVTEG